MVWMNNTYNFVVRW